MMIIENLDHAFEVALILVTIISATFGQYASTGQEMHLPPIVADLRRLSIVFILPSILAIMAWIGVYFTVSENWKMYLRTYAWSLLLFLMFLELLEFYVICGFTERPEWWSYTLIIPILFCLFVPIIPLLLIKRVLKGYERALRYKAHRFFVLDGKLTLLRKYLPFILSWLTFWLVFLRAIY